jgi:uncharacterized protein (TIGR00369 family)
MDLKLSAEQLTQLLNAAFPSREGDTPILVEEVAPGRARIRMRYRDWMQRPGRVLSGPTLMAAADTAMYVVVMAHVGPALMAVTADMNLRFINKGALGDVIAEAGILKLGRRLVAMECRVWSDAARQQLVMHATGSYARPASEN